MIYYGSSRNIANNAGATIVGPLVAFTIPSYDVLTLCRFGPCSTDVCTEGKAMDTIAAMETNGMRDAGYNLDS